MSQDVTLTREEFERLQKHIAELETRLQNMEAEDTGEDEDDDADHWYDTMSDTGSRAFKETSKMVSSFIEAGVEALNETAHAMGDMSEDGRERSDDIPGGIISMMRRAIDIQKKALDKFEDTYNKED